MARNDEMITINVAAAELTVRPLTLRSWIYLGLVPSIKIGPARIDARGRDRRAVRLLRKDVNGLINANTQGSAA